MKTPKNYAQGDIISYDTICKEERNVRLQRGMHFRFDEQYSILLASTRENSPYDDEIINEGKTLIGYAVIKAAMVPISPLLLSTGGATNTKGIINKIDEK